MKVIELDKKLKKKLRRMERDVETTDVMFNV